VTAPGAALVAGLTAARTAVVEAELAELEPGLVPLLRRELPRAKDVVARRLLAAALREGLIDRARAAGLGVSVEGYGFDRLEPSEPVDADPAQLLDLVTATVVPAIREELADATVNLALALARRSLVEPALLAQARTEAAADMVELTAGLDPDERAVAFERLATEGHNLHPCGRTRLGWRVADVLAYDLESPLTSVGFLAVRRDLHVGDEVAGDLLNRADLATALRTAGLDAERYAVTPVHPWQRRHALRGRYAGLHAEGVLVPLEVELPALVTAALRTLLVGGTGYERASHYVKLSLDIQVTSTRRTISVASTRNGPALSRVLPDLIEDDRVLLLTEPAGSAVATPGDPAPRDRDLAAIIRTGLSGALHPGEVAIPGGALPARDPLTGATVVAGLVDRYARAVGIPIRGQAALSFVTEYAGLLLPPVLGLAARYGIGLEAHLQNCIPTFVDGRPRRLAVRDLAGLRVHTPRLVASLPSPPSLWPGSVTVTDDIDVMRSKVGYTALQAHLGEVILRLVQSHGLVEAAAWSAVRSIVDDVYADLAAVPGLAERARADHGFITAPVVPHKALLRMRLRAAAGHAGDEYTGVANALWRR
jgi:siderophore synthetase component